MSMVDNFIDPAGHDNQKRIRGKVKWYNGRRGYGFVQIGDREVFIHRSALYRFGLYRMFSEDEVIVSLGASERGHIIVELHGIERPPLPEYLHARHQLEGEIKGVVKFFNQTRGYGFIMTDPEQEDVFVHSRILEQNGLVTLFPNQVVLVTLEASEKGMQVITIRLIGDKLNDSETEETPQAATCGEAETSDKAVRTG